MAAAGSSHLGSGAVDTVGKAIAGRTPSASSYMTTAQPRRTNSPRRTAGPLLPWRSARPVAALVTIPFARSHGAASSATVAMPSAGAEPVSLRALADRVGIRLLASTQRPGQPGCSYLGGQHEGRADVRSPLRRADAAVPARAATTLLLLHTGHEMCDGRSYSSLRQSGASFLSSARIPGR
jgi:hypothetical protein